jgi:hypothetical protein
MPSLTMRAVIDALLPKGQAWVPKKDGGLDNFLDGIGDNADVMYALMSQLGVLRDPRLTAQLDDLEKEFGIMKDDRLTEALRRIQLAAVKYAKAGTGSDTDLEDILQAAGFNLQVHQNSPEVNPGHYTPRRYSTICDDVNAYCGEPSAVCGMYGGRLLVNPRDYVSQIPAYIMQCDDDIAYCAEPAAQCGHFLTVTRTAVSHNVPVDSDRWRYIFFVAAAFTKWTELLDAKMEESEFLHWLPNINTRLEKDTTIRHSGAQSLRVASNENFQQQESEPDLSDPTLDITLRMKDQGSNDVPDVAWKNKVGTGSHYTLQIYNNLSGIDRLPVGLTMNGATEFPQIRYKGGDANAVDFPAWTYGPTLDITGGVAPSYNQGSPLLGLNDDSVKFNNGAAYEDTAGLGGQVTTQDFVIELIFKHFAPSTDFLMGTYSTIGWAAYISAAGLLNFFIYDSGGGIAVRSAAVLVPNHYYHGMLFVNRDEASTNGSQVYLNGAASGAGKDISPYAGDLTGADLTIGKKSGATNNSETNFLYGAMYRRSNWSQAGASGPAEWALIAEDRFSRLTNNFPDLNLGTGLPTTKVRATEASLDKIENDVRKIYYVGAGWLRQVHRRDSNPLDIYGALDELQSQNEFTYSADFNNAAWVKTRCTINSDGIAVPDKSTDGDGLIGTAVSNTHYVTQSIASSATTHIFSIFLKAGDKSWAYINVPSVANANAYYNLGTPGLGTVGAAATAYFEDWGDGWVLCIITYTGGAGAHDHDIYAANSDGSNVYTGDGSTENIWMWGAQHETNGTGYPTSYIPTTSGAVTRNKDELKYKMDDGNLSGVNQGAIAANVLMPNLNLPVDSFIGALSDGAAAADKMTVHIDATGDKATWVSAASGGNAGLADVADDIADGVIHEVRATWQTDNVKVLSDGVAGTADTTVDIPNDIDEFVISADENIANHGISKVLSNIRIYDIPTELTEKWFSVGGIFSTETTDPKEGESNFRISYSGTNNPYALQNIAATSGNFYRVTGWARGDGTYLPRVGMNNSFQGAWVGTASEEWQRVDFIVRALSTNIYIFTDCTGAGYCEFDSISCAEIANVSSNYFIDLDMEYVGELEDGLMELSTVVDWSTGGAPTVTKEDRTALSPFGRVGAYEGLRFIKVLSTSATLTNIYQDVVAQNKTYRLRGAARSDGSEIPKISVNQLAGVTDIWTGTNIHSDWQTFDFSFTKTGTGTQINFYFNATAGSKEVHWDSLRLEELDSAGIPVQGGMSYWGAGGTATVTKEITTPVDGKQCLRVAYGSGSPFRAVQDRSTAAGEYYRVRGYARSDGIAVPSVEMGNNDQKWQGVNTHLNWQYFDFCGTPGAAGFGHLWLVGTGASGYVEFDKIDISPILESGPLTSVDAFDIITAYGPGILFNGSTTWIDCTTAYGDFTDNFTLAAWIRTEDNTTTVLARRDLTNTQYQFRIDGSGRPSLYDGASSFNAVDDVADGNWHFLCCVINGAASQWYIDGVAKGSTFNPAITSYILKFEVGSYNNGAAQNFNGTIVSPSVYGEVKTAADVLDLYDTDRFYAVSGPYAEQVLSETITSRRIRGYIWSDGSSVPQIFTRDLSGIWHENLEGIEVFSGDTVVVDGNMEAAGVTDWGVGGAAVLTKSTYNPYQGFQVLNVTRTVASFGDARQSILTIGKTYRVTGWARGDGSHLPSVAYQNSTVWSGTISQEWQRIDATAEVVGGNLLRLVNFFSSGDGYVEFDDISVVEVLDAPVLSEKYFDIPIDNDFDAIRLISKYNGGGFSNFDDMSIIFPAMELGQVLRERVEVLERLILKHKPTHSWCVLLIEEI